MIDRIFGGEAGMSAVKRRNSFERVLVDMNTQCDFLLPTGALPAANRAEVLPNIRRIMNWGRISGVPIISSLEAHRHGESQRGLPLHCVDRSSGQKKLPFTMMPRRMMLFGDNTLDLPIDPFRRFQQVIFTKRDRDFLSNPKADRLIHSIRADHYVVFGVIAEYCIKAAVLGLIARRQFAVVVSDACGYWSANEGELSLRQMEAKGAVLITTEELVTGSADARIKELAAARCMSSYEENEEAPHAETNSNGNGNGNGNGHSKRNGDGHHGKISAQGATPRTSRTIPEPEHDSDHLPIEVIRQRAKPGRTSRSPSELA